MVDESKTTTAKRRSRKLIDEIADKTEALGETKRFKDKPNNPYPHRFSFDVSPVMYQRIRKARLMLDKTSNEMFREAVDNYLEIRGF